MSKSAMKMKKKREAKKAKKEAEGESTPQQQQQQLQHTNGVSIPDITSDDPEIAKKIKKVRRVS